MNWNQDLDLDCEMNLVLPSLGLGSYLDINMNWDQDLDLELEYEMNLDLPSLRSNLDKRPGFHVDAVIRSDEFKAKIQVSNYKTILWTENSVTDWECFLAEEEESPNPSASLIQDFRQALAESQETLNFTLENFLNSIGFHNTYDAFALHSTK